MTQEEFAHKNSRSFAELSKMWSYGHAVSILPASERRNNTCCIIESESVDLLNSLRTFWLFANVTRRSYRTV